MRRQGFGHRLVVMGEERAGFRRHPRDVRLGTRKAVHRIVTNKEKQGLKLHLIGAIAAQNIPAQIARMRLQLRQHDGAHKLFIGAGRRRGCPSPPKARDHDGFLPPPRSPAGQHPLFALPVFKVTYGPFIDHVARVEGGGRLDEDHLHLLGGDRQVLHPPRNDQQFTGVQHNVPVRQSNRQRPFVDPKQLVLVIMMVPEKLALQLHHFDVGFVDLGHDAWIPGVLHRLKAFG